MGVHNANDDQNQYGGTRRSLCNHLRLDKTTQSSYIIFPLNSGNFKIKFGVVQLLPMLQWMDKESPYLHLHEFEKVCTKISTE